MIDNKSERYMRVEAQVRGVVSGCRDVVANMANAAALIRAEFGFWWVGFYRVVPKDSGGEDLLLGPFQGPVACVRIGRGHGVCGTAWAEGRTVVVPDVEQFPGHIACSAESRSELVVPLFSDGRVVAVLDIDSCSLNGFDDVDARRLEAIAALVAEGSDFSRCQPS